MVDKPLATPESPLGILPPDPQEVEVPQDNPDAQGMELNLDGSPIEEKKPVAAQDFDSNLALHLSEATLVQVASELIQAIDEDRRGRTEWIETYKKGLDYLGIKEEKKSVPWEGACGTTHPMILQAVTRHQSRALVKLFPQYGPCKIDVELGNQDNTKLQGLVAKCERRWNRYIGKKVPELRTETDLLLFSQASIGWAAKKLYYDEKLGRVTSVFIPAESFLIPYGYPNLETCPRYTEILRKTPAQVRSLQRRKVYRDVPVNAPPVQMDEIDQKKAELTGQEASVVLDDTIILLEIHVDYNFDEDQHGDRNGDLSPYIITVDEYSHQILSIRRGWREEDGIRRKRPVYIAYPFVPGDGSYAYGYIHLLGQIASGVTKNLRQLVDAGTLANLSGGFKSKFAKFTNANAGPVGPGEWRDIDLAPEELQYAFKELPYKEPSQTLLALMQGMIEEGKSFASTADLDISASSQNAPVGTTLALLERSLEVSNAIQLRLYQSFGSEMTLLMELMQEYQPQEFVQIFGELIQAIGSVDILPVGDPTSATLSQRIIQLQSVLQIAQQSPQSFNLVALFRTALTAMGVQDVDVLVPEPAQVQPADPVQETMAILTGKPVKAFEYQDHDAHLSVHTALAKDPYYQMQLQQNPQAPQIMAANESHIAEHLAFQFRQQVQQQLGVQLPPLGKLPPDVENSIASLVAPAVQQVVQTHAAQAQQMAQQQQGQDPALALQAQELQLKNKDIDLKHQQFMQKLSEEQTARQVKSQIERERIASSERQAQWANQTKLEETRESRRTDRVGQVIDFAQAKQDRQHEQVMTERERQDKALETATQQQHDIRQQNLDHSRELRKQTLEHHRGMQELAQDQMQAAMQHDIAQQQLDKPTPTPSGD